MSETIITLINLPPVISQLFGVKTAVDLDLPIAFSIRLTKNVEQLSILNKISTEGALGFSVPFGPTNDRLFTEYKTPITLGGATEFYSVRVIVKGTPLQFTRLIVKGKNEPTREWELELLRDPNHWIELAQTVKTNDLDYGTFQVIKTNIVNSWSNNTYDGDYRDLQTGSPVYWPLVDYGGWADQTLPPQNAPENRVKAVAVEDFRPWLSFRYILQAGFCKFGWSIESVLFESPEFRRIYMYALRPDYFVASDNQAGGRVVGGIFTTQNFNNGDVLTLNEVTVQSDYAVIDNSNIGNIKRYCGVKNYPGVSLKYRFRFNGEFWNDRTQIFKPSFGVFEVIPRTPSGLRFSGQMISEFTEDLEFAPGERKRVSFDQVVTLAPGQMAAIHVPILPSTSLGFKCMGGFQFSVVPANDSYMTNDIIDVRLSVSPDQTILDWTKALVHLCNGRIDTDFETRTVTIYPNRTSNFWGRTIPGFVLRESPIVNLNSLVKPESIKTKPVRNDLKKFTRFEFKESTDAFIRSQNSPLPAHSRTLLNGNTLPDQVEKVTNPLIEPTLEGIPKNIGSGAAGRDALPNLPRLWDNTDNKRSFQIGVRMLYAYGPCRQVDPNPINRNNELTSFFFDVKPSNTNNGLVTNFGYATQSPTWKITPNPIVVDLVFGVKVRDLFTIFYLGYTQDNRQGQLVDLLLMMNLAKYGEYNFRRLYQFHMNGIAITAPMTAIRDFSSAENLPTPTTFFVEPASLDCCDLPCGCQFVECEYYQDLGGFMRQSTFNALRITSFIVDGIQLLSAPVTLGQRKFIDVSGRPYITNLVDQLNSIGAPYFSFSYSTRVHPQKGLRFFKIKKLVCNEFEIIVSENSNEKYRYSDTQQQQKVFQSGWSQMGYGTQFMSVPENCLTTTEY
ncbi:MAG: hypothetical protein ACRC1D_03445 [Culicoidibacterales bacterium]